MKRWVAVFALALSVRSAARSSTPANALLLKGDPGSDGDPTSAAAEAVLDARYVLKSGDTMGGPLTFSPPLTRHNFLSPTAFAPQTGTAPLGLSVPWTLLGTASTRHSNGESGGILTPVDVPDGATLTGVECLVSNGETGLPFGFGVYESTLASNAFSNLQCATANIAETPLTDVDLSPATPCTNIAGTGTDSPTLQTIQAGMRASVANDMLLFDCSLDYLVPQL